MRNSLSRMIASVFYIGFIPGAPGTYGSLAAIIGFLAAHFVTHRITPVLHLSIIGFITMAGVLTSARISRSTGIEDPSYIVIDEVAGQLVTLLFLPITAMNIILGFAAFRLFDIWKPFPIRKLESLKNGVGVMADDLLAGIYGNLILQLLNFFLRRL
jgi:phosphatidylglycerophosphatase A